MTKQIHKRKRRNPVTCRDCRKYIECPEASRMYPCTVFKRRKRRKLSEDAWNFIGACEVMLLAPMMCIILNVIRCFIN